MRFSGRPNTCATMELPVNAHVVVATTAALDDAGRAAVLRLLDEHLEPRAAGDDEWPHREMLDQQLDAPDRLHILVASQPDGEVIGVLLALRRSATRCFVYWVLVDHRHRRRGIASRLVDRLEATTAPDCFEGFVDPDDPVARAFWRSRGWHQVRPDRPGLMRRSVGTPRPSEPVSSTSSAGSTSVVRSD